jgi:penicillin amidase
VPHIFCAAELDAYFALGFVHGQDRFFQMDLTRRAIEGRLSELLGPTALPRDIYARAHGWNRLVSAAPHDYPHDVRQALEYYTEGVNEALHRAAPAPEYTLLLARPEPWTIEDSAAVALAMTVELVSGFQQEVDAMSLRRLLTPTQLAELSGSYPDWAPRSIDVDAAVTATETPSGAQTFSSQKPHGSNAWALGGAKTDSGKPILANDPHLGLSLPGAFYLSRLSVGRGSLVGATLPGIPFMVIGHNDHLAWAQTASQVDGEDLLPAPKDLEAPEVSRHQEGIRVRTGPISYVDESHTFYSTANGPILRRQDISALPEDVVLRSIALRGGNAVLTALLHMQWATTLNEFMAASAPWKAPLTTMLVASVTGDIALLATGDLPLRNAAGEWIGTIPRAEAPTAVNPTASMLIAANNLVPSANYPYPMPGSYDPYRIGRIQEALVGGTHHDVASTELLQRDNTSLFARHMLTALRSKIKPQTSLGVAAWADLERWDAGMSAQRKEPLLFAAWMRELARLTYADELDDAGSSSDFGSRRALMEATFGGSLGHWCDVEGTTTIETCDAIASAALDRAADSVARLQGSDAAETWGHFHQATFEHPLLGMVPESLRGYFSVTMEDGGDPSTINAGGYANDTKFTKVFGASLRVVFDLADLNRSHFQLAPGQSGNILSPHCRDLMDSWKSGHGFEIRTDWNASKPPAGSQALRLEN